MTASIHSRSSYTTGYEKLWMLLDIRDEALVHQLETSLRRLGCFHADDLVFVDEKELPSKMMSRVQIAKFQAICKYHQMGFCLKPSLTMKEIMRVVNPPPEAQNGGVQPKTLAPTHRPIPIQTTRDERPASTSNNLYPQKPSVNRQVSPTSVTTDDDQQQASQPRRNLNVVLIGNSEPGTPGWLHLNQFRDDKDLIKMGVYVHTIVQPKTNDEAYIEFCREQTIRLLTNLEDLTTTSDDDNNRGKRRCVVPGPYLFVLLTSRIHDLFKLLQHTQPEAIFMDIPGTMTAKSLQTLEDYLRERNIPTYLGGVAGSTSRTIAPYIQGTLDLASSSGMDPLVTLSVEQCGDPTVTTKYEKAGRPQRQHLDSLLAQGSIFKTCCFPELVMAVMYFGIKVEALCRFRVNPALTERCKSNSGVGGHRAAGRSSDFSKVAFQMTTESGIQVSILANRCGTAEAYVGSVSDAQGNVVRQFDHAHKNCDILLKKRLVRSILGDATNNGKSSRADPIVLPTIRVGVEALRLAEEALTHVDKAMGDGLTSKPAEDQPSPPRRGILRWISSRASGGA